MWRFVVAVALTSCGAGLSGTMLASSTPAPVAAASAAPETAAAAPDDGHRIYIRGVANMTRADAEELLRHDGLTNIVAAGDTDPAYARDELVCEQIPPAGTKVAPGATVTIRYCNTYQAPKMSPVLAGLSVEAAKQRAKTAGYAGPIEVLQLSEFDKDCKADTVCRVSPDHWELNQEVLTLYVNRKVAISVPD
jgi:beta-lactam-binding protein with PASTA domain